MGGLYQNIAGLFRQYEVNEGFGSFIIGMILNLAYRAGCPAGLVINGAVDFLPLGADQGLVRNEIQAYQVFAAPVFWPGVKPDGVNCATCGFKAFR